MTTSGPGASKPSRKKHITLTSHTRGKSAEAPDLVWGERDPMKRGPIVGSLTNPAHKNCIGTHSGSYAVYRALAISAGALDAMHKPDLTNTAPVEEIGPFESWYDSKKIVSLDPWGSVVGRVFKPYFDKGFDIRPTIAVTRAHMNMPELLGVIKSGRLKPDGKILAPNGDCKVTKAAVEPVWYLPGIAERFQISENDLRRGLFEHTGGMFPELITRPDLKVFLPPIGGQTLYFFGDLKTVSDPSKPLAVRVHDECNGSDVFGSDICTCRPYLVHGIEVCILPSFFDPSQVATLRSSDYAAVEQEAQRLRSSLGIRPSATDRLRVALMPIDCQIAFCMPGQPLYVGGRSGTGAVDDTRRLCEFIFREVGALTSIYPTMDTHFVYQIFHPAFLVDAKGNHPAPFTMISLKEIEDGTWSVDPAAAYAITGDAGAFVALQRHLVHYARQLSQGGKYALTVWPYHCLLGGVDHALMPALHEALVYHSLVRQTQIHPQIKGGNPLTENYSIFKPEVTEGADGRPIAQRNTVFMQALLSHDVVVIAGQAKSHCVAWSIYDFLGELKAKDPQLASRVYLLDDCSSPVVVPGVIDFTDQADAAYREFAAAGMHVVSSTTPIADWPGIDRAKLRA